MTCNVRYCGDETQCLDCGARWDTNDPDPPCGAHGRDTADEAEARAEDFTAIALAVLVVGLGVAGLVAWAAYLASVAAGRAVVSLLLAGAS